MKANVDELWLKADEIKENEVETCFFNPFGTCFDSRCRWKGEKVIWLFISWFNKTWNLVLCLPIWHLFTLSPLISEVLWWSFTGISCLSVVCVETSGRKWKEGERNVKDECFTAFRCISTGCKPSESVKANLMKN